MSSYTSSWPAFTMAMSSPAAMAWYRNAECIARRTGSFPRNENERLDTPPLTFTPGHRCLISRVASMNAFANSLCSSIPVPTARMFGSMMMSLGVEPGPVKEQPVRALGDLDLPRDGIGLAALVEAHDDDRGPVGPATAAFCRKSSSPSFRLIEFTTALPWTHFKPAWSTSHFDESIMIGTFAISGSVAIRLRKVVMAATPSIRSASMFTSTRLAPFSTWSRAMSTPAWKSPDSISRANRFDPVMFVRSPTITKPVSGVILNGSKPANDVMVSAAGISRGAASRTASTIIRMWSGRRPAAATDEVDETRSRELRQQRAGRLRALVEPAERVGEAGVRIARDGQRVRSRRAPPPTGGSRERPSEQLTPTTTGSAWATEVQNASIVWPDSVRPLLSTIVTEIQRGSSGATSSAAAIAAFAFSVSKIVSMSKRSAPAVAEAPDLLRVRLVHLVEGDLAERGVLDVGGERERDVQRPERSGHEAIRAGTGRRFLRQASPFDVHVVDGILQAVVALADRGGRERVGGGDVRPGLEVGLVDLGDDPRLGQVQQVGVALDVVVVAGEPFAPELALGEAAALEQHAPGAVEDHDPLREQSFERRPGVHGHQSTGPPPPARNDWHGRHDPG